MILLYRLIPLLTGITLLLGFEIIFTQPNSLLFVGTTMIVILAISVVALTRSDRRRVWTFLLAPLLLMSGTLLFILFPEKSLYRQGIVVLASSMVWNYLEQVFAFHFGTKTYQAFALENISFYINIASIFLIIGGMFGLRYYVGTPFFLVLGVSLVVLLLSTFHTLTMGKVGGKIRMVFTVLIAGLCFELVLALSFLPSDLYVNGLLTATFFYILLSLTHYYLRSTLDRSRVRRYVLVGLFVIVLTVLTASWR